MTEQQERIVKTDGPFYFMKAKDGQVYFVIKAKNNRVVATSEMYPKLAIAEKGAEAVVRALFDRVMSGVL